MDHQHNSSLLHSRSTSTTFPHASSSSWTAHLDHQCFHPSDSTNQTLKSYFYPSQNPLGTNGLQKQITTYKTEADKQLLYQQSTIPPHLIVLNNILAITRSLTSMTCSYGLNEHSILTTSFPTSPMRYSHSWLPITLVLPYTIYFHLPVKSSRSKQESFEEAGGAHQCHRKEECHWIWQDKFCPTLGAR